MKLIFELSKTETELWPVMSAEANKFRINTRKLIKAVLAGLKTKTNSALYTVAYIKPFDCDILLEEIKRN